MDTTNQTTEKEAVGRLGNPLSKLRMLGGLIAALVLMVVVLALAGRSGGTLENPVGYRIWEWAMVAIAAAIVVVGVLDSLRIGRLSRLLLSAIASSTAFWQETYGDWGTYLLYSPRFATYEWGETAFTSPVRCWWFIAGYIFFYTPLFFALEKTYYLVKAGWPDRNPYIATTVIAFPVFYIFDLTVEGLAHGLGFWHYQYSFGPSMAVGTGHFPLLWPILEQVPFIVLAVIGLTYRRPNGDDVFEAAARAVLRRPPGQVSILISWIVILNAVFWITTIMPLMILRWIAGPASVVIP